MYTGTSCNETTADREDHFNLIPQQWKTKYEPAENNKIPIDELSQQNIVIGSSLGLLLVLILAVLMAHAFRRRPTTTILKFVHRFRGFDEDNQRIYDGFVSYASAEFDTDFVVRNLLPILEGRHKFKLCVHQRNFVPGSFIADNIMSAVHLSRRTIMIITPDYLTSDWCKFEYQMALQEMMVDRHRVLPIIAGDVEELKEKMKGAMRRLLESVTWLEYPGHEAGQDKLDRFWTKLVRSMPKKPAPVEDIEEVEEIEFVDILTL